MHRNAIYFQVCMTLDCGRRRWTRAAGVCATAKCTDVCSLFSGFIKSTSFVYVAYMSNLISLKFDIQ
jgi:hypothetical protein